MNSLFIERDKPRCYNEAVIVELAWNFDVGQDI